MIAFHSAAHFHHNLSGARWYATEITLCPLAYRQRHLGLAMNSVNQGAAAAVAVAAAAVGLVQ